MARYVSLIRFTDQGIRSLIKSPSRAQAFRKAATKAGVKVETLLWTVGAYDGVLILSGKSEETILGLLARLAAAGNVRTQSLQAFDEEALRRMVG